MRVAIILQPIEDENATGISIEFEELAEAMLKDPECLMSVETMLVGIFDEALRAIRQRKAFKQNRAMIEAEDAEKKPRTREQSECLGCQIDITDPRIVRITKELVRCGMCGKFSNPVYDASGKMISPAAQGAA